MLTANKLEKIMELEEQLRAEYEKKIASKDEAIEALNAEQHGLRATIDKQKSTIETQLETISKLSMEASANQKVEQKNRELHNRCDNMLEEVADQKKRIKSLQSDLADARTENKSLKQYDSAKMKKNLDSSKKKLAEKTKASDMLQKSLSKSKAENSESQRKVKELEEKIAELEPAEEAQEEEAA